MSDNAEEASTGMMQVPSLDEGAAVERLQIKNTSQFGQMLWIGFYTGILNVITLTLFRFWGRTHFRRRLWADTTINGEPLEYTGTGKELFIGFLLTLLTVMLPVLGTLIAAQVFFGEAGFAAAYLLVYLVLFYLAGAAIFLARRYHLSRTRFRSVRFAQTGSIWGYAWANFGYTLLNVVTLGWAMPWSRLKLSRRMWDNAYFGNAKIDFQAIKQGPKEPVYKSFALAWLFMPVMTIGAFAVLFNFSRGRGGHEAEYVWVLLLLLLVGVVLWCWHEAVMIRYILKHLKLDGASVSSRLRMSDILELAITNLLIVMCTLGFGTMVAQMRLWKRIANTMEITGAIDFAVIQQAEQKSPKTGEGLADGLDLISNF